MSNAGGIEMADTRAFVPPAVAAKIAEIEPRARRLAGRLIGCSAVRSKSRGPLRTALRIGGCDRARRRRRGHQARLHHRAKESPPPAEISERLKDAFLFFVILVGNEFLHVDA